jgi:hypothetical protein
MDKFKFVGVELVRSSTPKKVKKIIEKITKTGLLSRNCKDTNQIYREAYEEFCLLTPDDIAQRSSINNLENYAEGSTLYKFKDKTPSHVKGAIAYNILIKELKVDNKREKIQTGQKVKKLYCKKNKYGLDAISYVADYPTEFNLPVDSDRMFNKLVTKPISSLYEAIGWIIPQLNKEPQTDLFELFGI